MSESIAVVPAVERGKQMAPEPWLAAAGPLRLAWRALLLDERAYAAVAKRPRPLREGWLILLWILGVVLLARLIGLGLNWLTSPQLESIQTLIREFITGLPWYGEQVRQGPAFAAQFAQNYALAWEGLRALLGIQTPASTALWAGVTALNTLLVWFAYGTLAHFTARWLGGTGRWSQTLGVLSLAYAPLLLTAVELLPGATLPLGLLFWLMLVGKYQALRSAHLLTTGYTLAAVLLPYLLALLLLLAGALFGAALGLEQIPYVDQAIQTMRAGLLLWGIQ